MRIVLVTRGHPLLRWVIDEAARLGLEVEARPSPECAEGYYNISPTPLPEGCPGARVPHIGMVPDFLLAADRHNLWGDPEKALHVAAYERLSMIRASYRPAFSLGSLGVPSRPPPVLVAAEVYVRPGTPICDLASRRMSEGADLIVLGLDSWDRGLVQDYIEAVARCSKLYPVMADPGSEELMVRALEAGAHGGMSVTPEAVSGLPAHVRDEKAIVVLAMGGPREAVRAARRLARPILDPVLQPLVWPGLSRGLLRLERLAGEWEGPIMAGVNNVYELVDADTTGSIPVLVGLAAELGVSIVLATEESPKSYGAVLLSRMSADLASLALYYRSPPKDYPIRLLLARDKRVPMP